MHNWKCRHEIPWATFCRKRKNLFFTVYSFKQRNNHTCHIIKHYETDLVLYDKWNQEVKQTNGAESRRTVQRWVVHIPDHIFRKMNRCLWFQSSNYTEIGNVLETIRRFQRQFPNQWTPCRQTIMKNYNKYVHYGLSLNRNGNSGRSCLETAFETFWLFPEHYRFLYTLKP